LAASGAIPCTAGNFAREIAVSRFEQHGLLERKSGLFLPAREVAHHFTEFKTRTGVDAALDVLAAFSPVAAGDAALALGG